MVNKTTVKLDQYEEKLKGMENILEDVNERIIEVGKAKQKEAAWVK